MLIRLFEAADGQIVTTANPDGASRWGKMSLLSVRSSGEFRPGRILAVTKIVATNPNGWSGDPGLFGNFENSTLDSFREKSIYSHLAARCFAIHKLFNQSSHSYPNKTATNSQLIS